MEIVILIIVLALVFLVGGIAAFTHRGNAKETIAPPKRTGTIARSPDTAESGGGVDTLERPADVADAPPEAIEVEELEELELDRRPTFRERLGKARDALTGYFGSVFSRGIDDDTWEELEEALIRADVGVGTTMELLDELRAEVKAAGITEGPVLLEHVKAKLKGRLAGQDLSLSDAGTPAVWLFVGVNGVGKTTTIGKLARREVTDGKTIVLAAGDTFRAAAGEQLEMWANRASAEIVRGADGADPSSVIFDAIEHAASKDADVVMADTAGRLHTKTNLMEELSKVRRVAEKGAGTVTEVLLVLDATTGQNGLVQARQFTEAADLTGVVLTKLDGSARGGIVLAVQNELQIPVKLVGLGEGADDLIEFDPDEFVDALFE